MRVRVDGVLVLLVLVACAPIFAACGWAATHGYTPTGDRSLIALNADRALSSSPPSVGMPATLPVELDDGTEVLANHLGPAEFVALALPVRLAGPRPIGLLIGVAAINATAVALAVVAIDRLSSRQVSTWFTVMVAALGVGLGAPLLWDDWNPHITLYPILALLAASAAVVAGHRRWLPVAAVAASFVAQAHLSTVLLGLAMGAWALVAGLAVERRRGGAGAIRRWRWPLAATAGTLALLWLPPSANQLLGPQGNLALILRSLGQDRPSNGLSYAVEMLTRTFALPPLWLARPTSVFDLRSIGTLDRLVASVVLAALGVAVVSTLRRAATDLGRAALVATTAVALPVAAATLAISPAPPVGISFVRWLWPVGAFTWFALGVGLAPPIGAAIVRRRPDLAGLWRDPAVLRTSVATAVAISAVLVVALLLAPTTPRPDARDDWQAIATVADQVADALGDRSAHLVFDGGDAQFAGGPELWRRLHGAGTTVRVPASYTGGTSGVWALQPGEVPDAWVRLLGQVDGRSAPPTAPIEVLAIGLDDRDEADAWVADATEVLDGLSSEPIVLTPAALARARSLDGERPGETDRVLADARVAAFDRVVLAEIAAGEATSSPISAEQAAVLLDGLGRSRYLAVTVPPS